MTDRDEIVDAVRSYLFWDRMCKNSAEAQQEAETKAIALVNAMASKDYDTLDALIERLSHDETVFMLLHLIAVVTVLMQANLS